MESPFIMSFKSTPLVDAGLNLQAVFDLDSLSQELKDTLKAGCRDFSSFSQLIILAHGGKNLWSAFKESRIKSENPIDGFTCQTIQQFFSDQHKDMHYEILYPNGPLLNLQKLGSLAGWHHPSPFMVGVNQKWGPWFAYRAVILADSDFKTTKEWTSPSPCSFCSDKPCITKCPAKAYENNKLVLEKCIRYRKQPDSQCKDKCLSRLACPVGRSHRYEKDQMAYHYGISMKTIEKQP